MNSNCTSTSLVMKMELPRTKVSPKTRVGVMVVGLLGNNGSSLFAAHSMSKQKKDFDLWGSQREKGSCTSLFGESLSLTNVVEPFALTTKDIVAISGWDTRGDVTNIKEACIASGVIERAVIDEYSDKDWSDSALCKPGVWVPGFTSKVAKLRVDVHSVDSETSKTMVVEALCEDIDEFAEKHNLDHVVVFYSASTEGNVDTFTGLNDTAKNYNALLENGDTENLVSASQLYAYAAATSITKCTYINGAAQGVPPGLQDIFADNGRLAICSDLKTGQSLMKTSISEYLLLRGLKMTSISSWNTLNNNDGVVVGYGKPNKSKCKTKASMTDAFVANAPGVFTNVAVKDHGQDSAQDAKCSEEPEEVKEPNNNNIDHLVRIDHFPSGRYKDTKKAVDHYLATTCFGQDHTVDITSICPDTSLAVPIMLDLVIFADVFTRTHVNVNGTFEKLTSQQANLALSMLLKKPSYNEPEEGQLHSQFFSYSHAIFTGFLMYLRHNQEMNMEQRGEFTPANWSFLTLFK